MKKLRNTILSKYPNLAAYIDEIWPKKTSQLMSSKLKIKDSFVILYYLNDNLIFIENRDGDIFPHLKFLLQYPYIMPAFKCDKGAIPHIFSGADLMSPGLISATSSMDNVPKNTLIVS